MVHGQGGVEKPDRRAEIPNPVKIPAHSRLGCAACSGRYLFDFGASTGKTPEGGGLFRGRRRDRLMTRPKGKIPWDGQAGEAHE